MPRIELISPVEFAPTDPYHFEIDNLPLKNIVRRQNLINFSVDNLLEQTSSAAGTQGTFDNRISQSLDEDGNLRTSAVDEALHSVEAHEDTDDFVRMMRTQSDKLDLIADESTNFGTEVRNGVPLVLFDSGVMRLEDSDTVTWSVDVPNIVKANLAFPSSAAHDHFYGQLAVHADCASPDFINYKANNASTPFIEGSLRIYINGSRINEHEAIYVPGSLVDDPWILLTYTPDHTDGSFALSQAITDDDVIIIDYDRALV